MDRLEPTRETGGALIVLLLVLVPVAMVFGAFSMTMRGRDGRLENDVARERCFWAAESGIDDAIHKAGAGMLVSGSPWFLDLGDGTRCEVRAESIGRDGRDNDDDGEVDELDEDLLQVRSVGRHGAHAREIAVWLGRVPALPSFSAAATISSPATDIVLGGTPELSGRNHDLNGRLGDPTHSRQGLAIMEPSAVAQLSARITGPEESLVIGVDGPPSLGTTPAFDVDALAASIRNAANLVLTGGSYSGLSFGDIDTRVGFVTYRDGDLRLSGTTRGAGILLVTGDLRLSGRFNFKGVVIVLGDVIGGGTADIYGALVLGPSAGGLRAAGTFSLRYCREAVLFADSLVGRYTAFNGWQELAR